MEFQNKVIAVTGGANGIGKEIVLQLLNKGAKVVALDISENALNQLVEETKEFENQIFAHKLDITSKADVEALPEIILNKFEKINGLLNVAGIIQPFVKLPVLDYERINKVFDVNFNGTLYMVKTFLPYLLKNTESSFICNISSMGGFLPVPGQSVYGASKAGVKLLTESLYAELKNTNIKVSIVFPGSINTNITKNSNVDVSKLSSGSTKMPKMLSAQKAAEVILSGIEKEKFRILVGKDAKIMDILYRISPKFAVNLITKKMANLLPE